MPPVGALQSSTCPSSRSSSRPSSSSGSSSSAAPSRSSSQFLQMLPCSGAPRSGTGIRKAPTIWPENWSTYRASRLVDTGPPAGMTPRCGHGINLQGFYTKLHRPGDRKHLQVPLQRRSAQRRSRRTSCSARPAMRSLCISFVLLEALGSAKIESQFKPVLLFKFGSLGPANSKSTQARGKLRVGFKFESLVPPNLKPPEASFPTLPLQSQGSQQSKALCRGFMLSLLQREAP